MEGRGPVRLSWYDGGALPEAYASWKLPPDRKNGVVFIGEKGYLFADYSTWKLYPEADFADFKPPPRTIEESIGHHREWLAACRANDPAATTCRFEYSGLLTETVLLGTVAYRTGKALEWDHESLKATNCADADQFIHGEYRSGWGM